MNIDSGAQKTSHRADKMAHGLEALATEPGVWRQSQALRGGRREPANTGAPLVATGVVMALKFANTHAIKRK